jgi:DNA-binding LacI/PurR family transcriptional regulator
MAILQARPTLRDIGLKTGFHYSTVSLALRDHPRIPDSTKQIICEAAKGLGYQPDAMLSALCAYRLTKRRPKGQTVIAWITNHRTRTGWRMSACTRDYFEGASQRARERGYRLETFWLSEPGMTGDRMSRMNLREHDKRVDNNWLAAYLVEQTRLQPEHQLPPLVLEQWNARTFLSWVEHYRPDAIVTRLPEVIHSLRRAGYRLPDDVGVAYHTLDEKSRCLSGMKKNSFQIGVMAVDLLIDMLHRNERGIPVRPYLLMVEGSWVEGNTLRKPSELRASTTVVAE